MSNCKECNRLRNDDFAGCNDCKHFRRESSNKVLAYGTVFKGTCLKHNITVTADPLEWEGKPCYESRRTETPHTCTPSTDEEFWGKLAQLRNMIEQTVRIYPRYFEINQGNKTL